MKAKPTVVQFIDSLFRGGAQKVVVDIVEALPDCNHVVCYWSNENDLREELEKLGVTLVRIPFYGMWSFPYTWIRFFMLIRKYRPEFIHSHMFVPNLLVRMMPRYGFTTLATYHGECFEGSGWKASMTRWLERIFLYRTDKLIAVSRYIKEYLIVRLETKRDIEIVYNFGKAGPIAFLIPYLPLRIVATSNNHPYKNYPLLLNAMQQLKDEPVFLDIYGHGMQNIKDLANKLDLKNVSFKGVVANLDQILPMYNTYVITSNSGEGFSLSLLEAMNSGLPVVCSNLPQFLEAVGSDALIFSKNSEVELVDCIKRLIQDPKLIGRFSLGSKSRAQLFSKTIFVDHMRAIYGRV